MPNTLTSTINFAQPFVQYSPLTAGLGLEPAVSIASMIRNTMLTAPMTWNWNRKEDSSLVTKPNVQDYTVPLTDFGFLEKASLTDGQGNTNEVKYIYNTNALSKTTTASTQRPDHLSVMSYVPGVSVGLRFLGVPGQAYTVTLTYQLNAPQFGPYVIQSAANANGPNTAYTGIFTPQSLPVGQPVTVVGFGTSASPSPNDGVFIVVSCTATQLVLANAAGVSAVPSPQASAVNTSWAPIPDNYSDIYNNLFLSEVLANVEDPRAQIYRQRGVASLLAKQDGLNEMQKNAFSQLWLAKDAREIANILKVQNAVAARNV
jgi:hypothetical protein